MHLVKKMYFSANVFLKGVECDCAKVADISRCQVCENSFVVVTAVLLTQLQWAAWKQFQFILGPGSRPTKKITGYRTHLAILYSDL